MAPIAVLRCILVDDQADNHYIDLRASEARRAVRWRRREGSLQCRM